MLARQKGTTMSDKYLVVIKGPQWDPANASSEDQEQMSAAHRAFAEAVIGAGAQILGGEALQPASRATVITPARNGNPPVFTDGPFAEIAEVINGFYVLEVAGDNQAREIAALCPTYGHIELYPVMEIAKVY